MFKVLIKRFRWALYCAVIFVALVFLSDALTASAGDGAGIIGTFAIFVFLPAGVIALIWAIVEAVKDIVRVRVKGEAPPEDKPTVGAECAAKLKAGHAEFKSLDAAGKRRYIILRVLAVVLAAVSIMLFIKELIIVPTLVIIVGVALWLAASPKAYNAAVEGVRMLSCPAELTVEKLAGDIAALDSPLGTPYLARIKFVPGKSLVFGPDSEGEYLYIYKNAQGAPLYLAANPESAFIEERLTKPLRAPYEPRPGETGEELIIDRPDTDTLLDELTDAVSEWIETGTAAETEHFRRLAQ